LIVVVLVIRRLRARARLRRFLRELPAAAGEIRARVGELSQRIGLARCPDVRITELATGPLVVGCLRPTLVLPHGLLGLPELEGVLLHELAHLRRRDPLVQPIEALATTLFFFWPFVHLARRNLQSARELACDEWALHHGSSTPEEYARSL